METDCRRRTAHIRAEGDGDCKEWARRCRNRRRKDLNSVWNVNGIVYDVFDERVIEYTIICAKTYLIGGSIYTSSLFWVLKRNCLDQLHHSAIETTAPGGPVGEPLMYLSPKSNIKATARQLIFAPARATRH